MLILQNVTIARGAKILIEKFSLNVLEKNVIGIIGANGSGKSTLFSVIKGNLEADSGKVEIHKNIKIQFLEQETPGLDLSALQYTLSSDEVLFQIFETLALAEKNGDDATIVDCHCRLGEIDAYSAEARAAKILVGLGFAHSQLSQPVKAFSGGWRMRLNLAKCLFAQSHLLLLDEPTNHLDMEAIIWLENFIKHYQGAVLIVSHDRDFLDHTVTHIAHLENQQLKLYTGNYSSFEIERSNAIQQQKATYQKQQAKISQTMQFVNSFGAKASKAKQAQSRLKMLEKIKRVEPVYEKSPFTFRFMEPDRMPTPMIVMRSADLGYNNSTILKNITVNITAGQRLGLLGVNGAGKSTLIKGLCNELNLLKGTREIYPGTQIGYFAQHQVDYLPLDASPLSLFKDLPNAGLEKDILSYLGRFNFNRDQALSSLKYFSGGEKARLALALIIWNKPNLLLLDEPTNHIDMEVRQALMLALQEYVGAMILVSHDRYLMRALVDELFIIKEGSLIRFDGSVEDYQAL
jgi:ATP-binding cassette subfamily F protein 3